jgi:hypothetical protein
VQGTTGYPASGSAAGAGYNTRGQYNPYANTAAPSQPAAGAATGAAAATPSYEDPAAAYNQYKDTTGYGYYNQQQQQYQQYGQYPQQGYGQQYGQGR